MADNTSGNDFLPAADDTIRIEEAQLRYALSKLASRQQSTRTQRLDIETGTLDGVEGQPTSLDSSDYLMLPVRENPVSPQWMIALHAGDASEIVMRVRVVGDVVLGVVRQNDVVPDLDLRLYLAEEKGVSRRHAVLRPAADALYLIALQSTNGTRLNGVLVNVGNAMPLQDGDMITLGALSLIMRILPGPPDFS
jgi:pSer/pThr/pTyr-binding forkhead associated (FHA) protein